MTNAMMNPSTTSNEPTMSSREIAELTGKQHRNVMRDIESMMDQLGADIRGSAQLWTHPQNGQQYREYRLDRYHTEILVTGYDVKRRAAVIKRWYDLETGAVQPAVPNFNDPAAAARAWADAYEQQQLAQQEAQQATIERDSVIDTTTRHRQTLAEYARQFPRINSMKIKSDLKRAGYLYSSNKRNNPYRVYGQYRDELFVEKTDEVYSVITICPTEKGKEVINRLYTEGRLTMRL